VSVRGGDHQRGREQQRQSPLAQPAAPASRSVLRTTRAGPLAPLRRALPAAAPAPESQAGRARVVEREADPQYQRRRGVGRHAEAAPTRGPPSCGQDRQRRNQGESDRSTHGQRRARVRCRAGTRRHQHRRGKQERVRQQERRDELAGEIERALDPHRERPRRAEHGRQQLARRLDRSPDPSPLLALERLHVGRQLRGRLDGAVEAEAPAAELGAIAEIEVLGERVGRPAARVLDTGAAPDTGGAVEVEEQARGGARLLLDAEVGVEQRGLRAREPRGATIQVAPARLDHAHAGIGEGRHDAPQEVHRGHEVGVEDREQLAMGDAHPGGERAGLEAAAAQPTDVAHVDPARAMARDRRRRALAGVVGRVVEHLDLEAAGRVVERRRGADQPLDDVALVVDRELDGDHRPRRLASRTGAFLRHADAAA